MGIEFIFMVFYDSNNKLTSFIDWMVSVRYIVVYVLVFIRSVKRFLMYFFWIV